MDPVNNYNPPAMLGLPPGCAIDWWDNVWDGWQHSLAGNVQEALNCYRLADEGLTGGELNPSLSVLRHNLGEGSGSVHPILPTEDSVISVFLHPHTGESEGRIVSGFISDDHIGRFIDDADPGCHGLNIKEARPHVMVLSTGRCGTVSLSHLFRDSSLEPYHSYWFTPAAYSRWEMHCRLFSENYDDMSIANEWAACRAAEWLGDKPMIGLNHTDTIFAPVFAAIHPESRFVYLRRDPEMTFNSFYTKNQYHDGFGQFRPIMFDFSPYKFSAPEISDEDGIKHHIEHTEDFSRAFGRVMGDRFIEISSDRLFGQDREEIAKLLEFTGSDIPLDVAVEHFGTKINEKAHKAA